MNFSYLFRGKYQCLVFFKMGFSPDKVDLGLTKSIAFSEQPHFSHWSPYACSNEHLGQVPVTNLSARNLFEILS